MFQPVNEAYEEFKKEIGKYIMANFSGNDLKLSESSLEQLSWLQPNITISPQAANEKQPTQLSYEIKRALYRLAAFRLFKNNDESAWNKFNEIWSQAKMSKELFFKIGNAINKLPKEAQRALICSCLLTISDMAKTKITEYNEKAESSIDHQNDSEVFLSVFADGNLNLLKEHFPLFTKVDETTFAYLKHAFPHDAHARHLYFLEGKDIGPILDNIFQENSDALTIWMIRWWLNLAGFNINNLTADTLNQWNDFFTLIERDPKSAMTAHFEVVRNKMLADVTIPDIFTEENKNWAAHIGWFYTKGQLALEERQGLIDGYKMYILAVGDFVNQYYKDFLHNPNSITPTYTPALFTRVFELFKSDEGLSKLACEQYLVHNPEMEKVSSAQAAAAMATWFCSQALECVYQEAQSVRVSCYLITQPPKQGEKDILATLLHTWVNNNCYLNATLDEKNNLALTAERAPAEVFHF